MMRYPVALAFSIVLFPLSRALSLSNVEPRDNQVGLGWHFVQNGTSGVIALESIIVSDTLAIFFDNATNNPLQINGRSAWGALWNLETNTASPLEVRSNTFCASGGFLSNGTMVSIGGDNTNNVTGVYDGRMALRIFEPCTDPTGATCRLIEDPEHLILAETRWYPSSARIFDGSLIIVGGSHTQVPFSNNNPVNSLEFFPRKDGGVPRPLEVLERSLPVNLFPRIFALPDGKLLVIASNQTIIYDIEKDEETILPDIPNGVHVTNPFDGTATLLPLHPPDYTPEILLSSQDPASDQCSRITVTPEGIKRGWEVERMLEARTLNEMILMPNGKVLIINGAQTGYAAFNAVQDLIGFADADHPAFTPSVYTPDARLGHRISNVGMPTTDIARVYHSSVTLTPNGNILIAGSNPNNGIVNDTIFHSEFRVEYLNPPYMSVARPRLSNVPKRLNFNQEITVDVAIPPGLNKQASSIQVALMDLGFSSHAFHSSSRLVFMTASLSSNGRRLTIKTPPNNRIYPPGPAYIFLTVDDVTSAGVRVMVCRKLDRLTRVRHVWLDTFDRTRHILPRNLDPRDWSLVELERLVARAEILEQKWSGSGGVISPPCCGFRSINPNPHSLRAVALMGSYIICVDNPRHNLSTYRWIRKGLPLSNSNFVLEYEVPTHTRAFPQRHEERSDYHTTYLDHALATFYVISIPGFEGTSEKALVAEVKIDRLHSRPHLASCAPILINPERKRIYSLEVKAGFVFVHFVNANQGDSIDLNILNLQTQDVSLYRVRHPPSGSTQALTEGLSLGEARLSYHPTPECTDDKWWSANSEVLCFRDTYILGYLHLFHELLLYFFSSILKGGSEQGFRSDYSSRDFPYDILRSPIRRLPPNTDEYYAVFIHNY
ncbi:hypothetical protein NP233_g5380 [Leucocoprinus birnbaumii]|uniref:Copper radical oxidase n=1 Tax=Leucocoprinus birnbaumii TaxID=56174 RepID=A0AAD5VU76_9AGAR|nr:hypothetical protein NP233_g5380 [Leucocoprinus birnbaumii]